MVSKYYIHGVPREGFPFTDIRYEKITFLGKDKFKTENFNAGLDKTNEKTFEITATGVNVLTETYLHRNDTLVSKIIRGENLLLEPNQSATVHISIPGTVTEEVITTRTFMKDTVIDGRKALVFSETLRSETRTQKDSSTREGTGKLIYAEKLGLIFIERHFPDITFRSELIEHIPERHFLELQETRMKRVAFINLSETLDKGDDFAICDERNIFDYYNSGGNSSHGRSKKEMVQRILSKVDKKKLMDESGYLTFRFIVNCNGKAGRYVLEETSLDFEKKKFNAATTHHLYTIVKELQEWNPVVLTTPRDAYFYLTFKLSNGEITDILP